MSLAPCPIQDVPWGPSAFNNNNVQPIYMMAPPHLYGAQAPAPVQYPKQQSLPSSSSSSSSPSWLGVRPEVAVFALYVLFVVLIIFMFHINSKVTQLTHLLHYAMRVRQGM